LRQVSDQISIDSKIALLAEDSASHQEHFPDSAA